MISKIFIRKHVNSIAIAIYLILFGGLILLKPHFLYDTDGSLRQFGVGRSKKTILPIWLLAVILSIVSYFFVLYFITSTKPY